MKTKEFWEIVSTHLKKKLTAQQFKTWVKPLSIREKKNSIEIVAPNQFIQQWVVDRFSKEIIEIGKEHKIKNKILFVTEKGKKNSEPTNKSKEKNVFKP